MKKIMILPSEYLPMPPVKGGAVQTLIDNYVKWCEENMDYKFIIYSIKNVQAEKEAKKYKNVEYRYINNKSMRNKIRSIFRRGLKKFFNIPLPTEFIVEVCKDIKEESFDVILVENVDDAGYYLRKFYKGKIVLHLHNERFSAKDKRVQKKIEAFDEIYTVSNYIKETVLKCCKSTPVYVLYNGIDTERFDSHKYVDIREEYRSRWGIRENEVVIIAAARIIPEKGIKELTEAVVNMREELPVRLFLCGSKKYGENNEDKYLEEVRKIASRREDRVTFLGYVKHEEMPCIYSMADIGALTSHEDACPLTVIEYMCMGMPVVATRIGGIPELVTEGSSYLVDRDSQEMQEIIRVLEILVEDGHKRKIMGEEAYKAGMKMSNEFYCKNFTRLIEHVTNC